MFHSRKLNNRINNIHDERTLRIAYRDYKSTLKQLLQQNKSVSIHQRNLQILATLNRSNVSSVKYGTETITSLGAKIWKILPNDYKELTCLSTFKSKIKNWEADK